MKNTITLNHKDRLIVMDRTFAKFAENVRTEEYHILQSVRKDYPEYEVVRKQIKKNKSKECYSGLTYDYMKTYIKNHETKKEGAAITAELEEMIEISRCHSKAYRYPVIKKWFLERYPEISKFGMPKEEEIEDTIIETVEDTEELEIDPAA